MTKKPIKMTKLTIRKDVKGGLAQGAKHEAAVASGKSSFGVKHVLYSGALTKRDRRYERLCTKRDTARLRGHTSAQILKIIEESLD